MNTANGKRSQRHHRFHSQATTTNNKAKPLFEQKQKKHTQKIQRLTHSNLESLKLKARSGASKLRNPSEAGLHFRSIPIVDMDSVGQIGNICT